MEIFLPVVGYENCYQISNLGNVQRTQYFDNASNNHHKTNKNMKLQTFKGYLRVKLTMDGKSKVWFVHRLVAMAFIPNPDNLPQVNHKDGNKTNNHVDNLEWCTALQNNQHCMRNGLHRTRKPKLRRICQYALDGTFIRSYIHSYEAADITGLWETHIRDCALGNSSSSGGFMWRYIADENNCDNLVDFEFDLYSDPRSKVVLQYDINSNLINRFPTTHYAAKIMGCTQAAISNACCGRAKTCKGFILKYE